jgi:hypothetical protein
MKELDGAQRMARLLSEGISTWIRLHKNECDDPNCVEPLGLLAYLAHRAGMKVKDVPEFAQLLNRYETECVACEHLRN